MKFKTYLNYRNEFISQYNSLAKDEFGFVMLKNFKIRNFRKFIFIFSYDIVCDFSNTVSSISPVKYIVKMNTPANKIKITGDKSVIDKYPEQYERIIKYYYKIKSRNK